MASYGDQSERFTESIDYINVIPFQQTLLDNNLKLERGKTSILQVNVGLKCNQFCTHCHLDAGPARKEMMSWQVMEQVADLACQDYFDTIDITGGAPELHPRLQDFISMLSRSGAKIILRSNLSSLYQKDEELMNRLKHFEVNIVVSFPSLNEAQTESIRGNGIFKTSVNVLKKLNDIGYGNMESGLALDIVVNPSGAFLPQNQDSLEKRFKKVLDQKWGIHFNRLYTFANVPLGRFRSWLIKSGNFDNYMEKLASAFNPSAVDGLMCKTLLSVSWDGYFYDCDFNQAAGLFMGNKQQHISEISKPPEPGSLIAVDDHCYTCTAGAGFT